MVGWLVDGLIDRFIGGYDIDRSMYPSIHPSSQRAIHPHYIRLHFAMEHLATWLFSFQVREISKERDEMREVLESQEQQLQELSDQCPGQSGSNFILGNRCTSYDFDYLVDLAR